MANYKGRTPGTRRVVVNVRGNQHEKIVPGSKTEADEVEAKFRLKLGASRLSTRVAPAFADFCQLHYEPHAEQHLKESTWKDSRVYQVAALITHFGKRKLDAFEGPDVELYKRLRLRTVAPSTVNSELRVFRTILNFAGDEGFPVATLKWKRVPERGDSRCRVWSQAELDRLLEAAMARHPIMRKIFLFLANTGCRSGEAIAAEWDWIDFEEGMIRIPSNNYWQPKNGKPRELTLSDALRATLSGEREHRRWIFASRLGARYTDFPKDIFGEIRELAQVTGGPHTFRHTFASQYLKAQPDLFLLSKILGHSQQRVTELYTHLLPGHLERSRNVVNVGGGPVAVGPVMKAKAKARGPRGERGGPR